MSWPFDAWHRLAIRQLRLSPEDFWAMPLADWLALIVPDRPALDRARLQDLMETYPDD